MLTSTSDGSAESPFKPVAAVETKTQKVETLEVQDDRGLTREGRPKKKPGPAKGYKKNAAKAKAKPRAKAEKPVAETKAKAKAKPRAKAKTTPNPAQKVEAVALKQLYAKRAKIDAAIQKVEQHLNSIDAIVQDV